MCVLWWSIGWLEIRKVKFRETGENFDSDINLMRGSQTNIMSFKYLLKSTSVADYLNSRFGELKALPSKLDGMDSKLK